MTGWEEAKNSWDQVLSDIERARDSLGCSASNAWIRGQPRAGYSLLPFIHRKQDRPEASVTAGLNARRRSFLEKARVRLSDGGAYIRLEHSESALVDRFLKYRVSADQANTTYDHITTYLQAKEDHNAKVSRAKRISFIANRLNTTDLKELSPPELLKLIRSVSPSTTVGLSECENPDLFPNIQNQLIEVTSQERYREVQAEVEELRRLMDRCMWSAQHQVAACYGEQDAFHDFKFRIGETHSSSWETLALMQHFLVPTRLLDWTESLLVALQFALTKYFVALRTNWVTFKLLTKNGFESLPFAVPDVSLVDKLPSAERFPDAPSLDSPEQRPAIWILNPYRLARVTTGKNTIAEITLQNKLDYYESFFLKKDWPYEKALPIYSPWRNPRIAAQQGHFTVHGLDRRPLDAQVGDGVLRCVEIPAVAAVYGVRQLMNMIGFDRFTMFRDHDSLGKDVREKFSLT